MLDRPSLEDETWTGKAGGSAKGSPPGREAFAAGLVREHGCPGCWITADGPSSWEGTVAAAFTHALRRAAATRYTVTVL